MSVIPLEEGQSRALAYQISKACSALQRPSPKVHIRRRQNFSRWS